MATDGHGCGMASLIASDDLSDSVLHQATDGHGCGMASLIASDYLSECVLHQGEMRIALSFNVVARDKGGKGAVPGAADWELLADSSFLADGSG